MNNTQIIASPDMVLYSWDINKMLEVDLSHDPEAFLKICETLTRIGIASRGTKKLTQTCHILQKGGKYYILHFKEVFLLNKQASTLSVGDVARRNRIAALLESWNLLKVVKPESYVNMCPMSELKIIKSSEKSEWELVAKQELGKKAAERKKMQDLSQK